MNIEGLIISIGLLLLGLILGYLWESKEKDVEYTKPSDMRSTHMMSFITY
jgi:hypothetical protein